MLNVIWPIFIIVSFIYAMITGKITVINNSIFESSTSAVQLAISLLGTICLWNGIIKIASRTSLMKKLTYAISPLLKVLFPDLKKESQAYEEICSNVVANMLGLGNAATPLGLKAMRTLNKENPKKDTLSNSMAMFIVLNTASIQIIPTTVLAIRSAMGSENPTKILIPVWIVTIVAAATGIVVTKILMKKL